MNNPDSSQKERRSHIRKLIPDCRVYVPIFLRVFPGVDISLKGIGIEHLQWGMDLGSTLDISLIGEKSVILDTTPVNVVRRDKHRVGCMFMGLKESQSRILQKLIENNNKHIITPDYSLNSQSPEESEINTYEQVQVSLFAEDYLYYKNKAAANGISIDELLRVILHRVAQKGKV